jgi:hypothetical protein
VCEALEQRLTDEDADHAKLQRSRLQRAMRVASAVDEGDVGAIAPLLKALDRLGGRQRTAKVNEVYDNEARKRLIEKLDRVAAKLGLAAINMPPKEEAKPAPKAAPGPASGEPNGPPADKEKTPWGSAQVLEIARFGEANPRKSKLFPLIRFGRAWLALGRFDSIWFWLGIAKGSEKGGRDIEKGSSI